MKFRTLPAIFNFDCTVSWVEFPVRIIRIRFFRSFFTIRGSVFLSRKTELFRFFRFYEFLSKIITFLREKSSK